MNKTLVIQDLVKTYKGQNSPVLKGVSLTLQQGMAIGLVGESGCGKSTLAKIIMGLEPYASGTITLDGSELFSMSAQKRKKVVQMVFQDPYSSLNPRMRAWEIVSEPLAITGHFTKKALKEHAEEWLVRVGLAVEDSSKYPHQFSGGQRQRLGIARALISRPQFLICDEAVSALDVSVQAQILNLLLDLQQEMNLGLLFITHDLSVVRHIAHRTLVMYLGKIVEEAKMEDLWEKQLHPYSELLFQSRPHFGDIPHPRNTADGIQSSTNQADADNKGCLFAPRCAYVKEQCLQEMPKVTFHSELDRQASCFFPLL